MLQPCKQGLPTYVYECDLNTITAVVRPLANRDKILQGHMDCPLSDKGREQARQLGRRLRGGQSCCSLYK